MMSRRMRNIFLTLSALSLTWNASSAFSPMRPIHRHGGRSKGLYNKELKLAGEYWKPFWIIYCPDGKEKEQQTNCSTSGKLSYGGVLWELLLIMQRTRNVTFTHMIPPSSAWGNCYSKNNCTGMVGMVNRGEVDLALGNN